MESTFVGKKVKDKYAYQNELKLIAELKSPIRIEIEDIDRIEFKFNNNVKLTKIDK